ncbi:transposase (plasmid) [Nocardiopsis flavescens]|nr:transposase [Nocardiopsis flavescens]
MGPARPAHARRLRKGKKWADHRKIINAILFRTRTGIFWRDPPERYGPWEPAAGRHHRWCNDGTWQRIADRLRIDAASSQELIASIDSTTVRAHQHSAGAAKRGTESETNRTEPKHSAAPRAGWPRSRASAGTA